MSAYSAKREKKPEGTADVSNRPAQPPIKCPECSSQEIWKDGFRKIKNGKVQRYICRSCGYRFSKSASDLSVKIDIIDQFSEQSDSRCNFLQSNVSHSDFSFEPAIKDLSLKCRKNISSHCSSKQTIIGKVINSFPDYNRECRVCATEPKEAKNLVKVETRTENRLAGATEHNKQNIEGKIIDCLWNL